MAYGSTPSNSGVAGTINNLPKKAEYLGLQDFPSIEFRDTTPFSDNFFNIIEFPDTLTAGKNLFKLKASSGALVKDAKIYIEVLDSNGDTIYYEPIDYFEADGTRVVTIHITKDTPTGTARVFLASRIRRNPDTGESITVSKDWNNPNYINNPNLLWSRTVTVGPDRLNSSEIIYLPENPPRIFVQEIVQPYFQPQDVTNLEVEKPGVGTYQIIREQTVSKVADPSQPFGGFTAETTVMTGNSIMKTTENYFSSSMVGGTITVHNPTVNIGSGIDMSQYDDADIDFIDALAPGGDAADLLGYITDEDGRIIPEANLNHDSHDITDLGQFSTPTDILEATGNDLFDNVQISGSITFIISDVIHAKRARVVQISGFAEDELNTNGALSIRVPGIFTFIFGTQNTETYEHSTIAGVDSNYTASFILPFATIQTQQSQSFAQITIGNLEPESGDVYKIRTSYKPGGMFGDFIDAGDTIVERVEMLSDTGSFESEASVGTFYNRIGFFNNLADFNTYWTGSAIPSHYLYGGFQDDKVDLNVAFTPDVLLGGITLTPASNLPNGQIDHGLIRLKPEYPLNLTENTTYEISMKVVCVSNTNHTVDYSYRIHEALDRPRMEIFLSGSNVNTNTDSIIPSIATKDAYWDPAREIQVQQAGSVPGSVIEVTKNAGEHIDTQSGRAYHGNYVGPSIYPKSAGAYGGAERSKGTRIAILTSDSIPIGADAKDVKLTFTVTKDQPADMLIVIRRGVWAIADISIKTLKETGYTPNFAQINLRIPSQFINTPLTFKFQFLDYLSRQADLERVVYPVVFSGDNTVITGNNNLLQGSLYISNQIGTGMELAGTDSGFLRSTGYTGFKSASRTDQPGGFMIYSGSVLPSSPDNYQGVGLELVQDSSSFFRFKSNGPDAGLKVQTDKFFLGSETSQFISGSNGLFEISSTNFTLSPEGDVTGSNMLLTGTARADSFEFKEITLTAANSSSFLTTFITSGRKYYNLNLSAADAMFIRLDDELLYPIGTITPNTINGYAHQIFFESAHSTGHYLAQPPISSDIEIKVDSGDLVHESFITRDIRGTEYPNAFKLDSGARVMLVRSRFDWKIQSLSDFTGVTSSFGAVNLADGTTITTATPDVDGGSF